MERSRGRHIRDVAVALSVLVAAGCQGGEAEPAPTAVLPTPSAPSAPTVSASPPAADTEAAVDAYRSGREVLDRLYIEGDSTDPAGDLSPFFSGDYLAYLEEAVGDWVTQGGRSNEGPKLSSITPVGSPGESDGGRSVTLLACLDYTDVTAQVSGDEVNRGFTHVIDSVEMVDSGEGWRADDVSSEPLDTFDGSECQQ